MQHLLITITIAIITVATQQYLSTRKNWIIGIFLPTIWIGFSVWINYFSNLKTTRSLIPACVGMFLTLMFVWADGRVLVKKKVNEELNKMKIHDIK
ncbi:hypothetical protein QOZ83_01210 [Romboutsia sedimentorum]|uniref:hypothetical protein n=1 Tax=Romboutsia sedimentorum TaxID=1368474 RepID=UPI0024DEF01C|nr:hypothetical protein [Romboutsia sedimentorum]MDK2584464.1 hypothetical protein [Romboutsia sedimentorum]